MEVFKDEHQKRSLIFELYSPSFTNMYHYQVSMIHLFLADPCVSTNLSFYGLLLNDTIYRCSYSCAAFFSNL